MQIHTNIRIASSRICQPLVLTIHFRRVMRIIPIIILLLTQNVYSEEISSTTYGSVQIGMTAQQAFPYLVGYSSDGNSYAAQNGCYYLSPPSEERGVHFMVIDERIVRFDIDDEELNIKTEKGVGIGSTKDEVLRAYPMTNISPHQYLAPEGEYLEVKLTNSNGIVFETLHDVVTNFRIGSYPAVKYIEGCL